MGVMGFGRWAKNEAWHGKDKNAFRTDLAGLDGLPACLPWGLRDGVPVCFALLCSAPICLLYWHWLARLCCSSSLSFCRTERTSDWTVVYVRHLEA